MKKLMLVMALSAIAVLAPTEVMAQESDELAVDCDAQWYMLPQAQLWQPGDPLPTPLELLTCGRSPELIGEVVDYSVPSINGPNGVGADNECFYYPKGSYEAYYCFEELLASMGY